MTPGTTKIINLVVLSYSRARVINRQNAYHISRMVPRIQILNVKQVIGFLVQTSPTVDLSALKSRVGR
jgi:hypothetical protein